MVFHFFCVFISNNFQEVITGETKVVIMAVDLVAAEVVMVIMEEVRYEFQ